jgi:ribonuclease R
MDGADARDFDDAVFAEKHKKGWHIIVAIADVAHYVTPDSILDQEARERGNSVYFPDRVVPMLPELLSNGLCSLRPDEDRYCLAVHLWINKEGELLDYRFVRGLMRSQKRFIYEEAQAIYDTQETHPLKPLLEDLYDAYEALNRHREKRGALELDLPEFKTDISDEGEVKAIHARERMDSHKLIEEMMILANVAAADALMKTGKPAMFRAHEIPDKEKIQELRNILEPIGYSLFKGSGVNAKHFNALLNKAKGTQHSQLVSMTVLRSQMQAVYYPENIGHFGLGLQHYTHFTSPIRRYSDLIVHRALLELIDKKQNIELEARKKFPQIAEHISMTERRAMRAERDAFDRYLASYMRNRMGEEFDGYISSVNRAGLFIVLYENGANGFVPISHLDGYFIYNERKNILYQRRGKASFHVGQDVRVRVKEAYGLTGELLFALL